MASPTSYPDYNPYYAPPPAPLHVPYVDPIHNQVWLPPPIPIHTPLGYPYLPHSPAPPDPHQQPWPPHAFYNGPPYLVPQQNLSPPSDIAGGYIHRPSSAGPVVTASQVPLPAIPGLPAPSHPPYLLPLTQIQNPVPDEVSEPQAGKGERALRVTQHLRLSSRHRSVSPQSHRYPVPAAVENQVYEPFASDHPPFATPGRAPGAPSTPEAKLVHSPRPQLTPKHSFTRDPFLGATIKSERVEELEMMADAVNRRSRDLSNDLPKEMPDLFGSAIASKAQDSPLPVDSNVNKTLPGPPVPSGKPLLAPPSRARADMYFAEKNDALAETAPLPSDQTPPTPALLAVLPSRHRDAPQTESGLDALERRLLAEVGTRKIDVRPPAADVRSVLPIETAGLPPPTRSTAVPIPQKSPEPLHDSAISSLTLAGGLAGDDSDGEFDGRTHRAGQSRGGSSDGRGEARGGLHMYMRGRGQGTTPTKMERDRTHEERGMEEAERLKEKAKEGRTSGKKKDRATTKSSAKGRVAAWLGGIDPDVPPQEQVIPPSPSVLRDPQETFAAEDGVPQPQYPSIVDPWASLTMQAGPPADAPAPPNPRSSGFVPIATLKRNSIQAMPLLLRDTSMSEEANRIQDIWATGSPPAVYATPRTPLAITPVAPPMSIRTDRRVSPPSSNPITNKIVSAEPQRPLSYSAAARSKPKTPEPVRMQLKSPPPPPLPNKAVAPPPGRGRVHAAYPPTKPIDLEVKYDIRSARGGRGGKVTAVANLWSSGAIAGDAKGKEPAPAPRRVQAVPDISSQPTVPPKPARPERKLFSAAVMTPAPPRQAPPPTASSSAAAANNAPPRSRQDAQKRPDSRTLFSQGKPSPRVSPGPSPRKAVSPNALSTPAGDARAPKVGHSTEALVRPATAMEARKAQGSAPPAPMPRGLAAPGARTAPVVKGASDPAVVSSSHAVPTLSTTASLARPQRPGAQKLGGDVLTPLPTSGLVSGIIPTDGARPASPSKRVDLAFGQARLRDLIKKYQGQGQKS